MPRSSPSRRGKLVVLLLAALAMVAAACGGDDSGDASDDTSGGGTTDAIKAAWIYVGPVNDGGWSQAHNEGRKYVEEQLGDSVETTFKENVPEGAEATQVIEDLIADGNKIIFATSFGYGDALAELSEKHPDVYFEHATGVDTGDNLATYFGASEDTIYLTGLAAGAATENGSIGFVAPFPIPEVIRHINALAIGAQEVNPAATVKVVWTNTWFDPTTERQAAESLVQSGVDVLVSGQDSPATGEAAKAADIPFVGYDSDQSANFPGQWLTASLYDWGPYYLGRVEAAADGSWETGSYYGGIADGLVHLAPYGELVSAETRALIERRLGELEAGTFYEFTGPLTDQAGTVRVAEGVKMTLEEILTMDWFVQGVDGNPKG
ncbi:MAG: BMP family ABC transporter substrate-binding protein [Actinomycetota bacterium]|nr:BMP family ABC transporter substrate-binding protein [Actinomycetota bacterium]